MSTQIVSIDPAYTFTVTGNRTLKAVFASVSPQEYAYTGDVVSTTLYPGVYKLEAWGAEGGYRSNASYAGKGGYSVGAITLTETTTVFIRAGGSGNTGGTSGGFNGGGRRGTYNGGGGASDIRIGTDDYNHRVIVAGGGGSDGAANKAGGYGGGTAGQSITDKYGTGGFGGAQTGVSDSSWQASEPSENVTSETGAYGGFGFGGNGISINSGNGGAGGGGWYGGSGSMPDSSSDDDRGGGGGSGFVWTGVNAPAEFGLTEAHYLTNAQTIDGSKSFTSPTGTVETGHSGNGYVRITPVVLYVVSVVSEDTTKGTVSGGGQYEYGAQATITASPTSGYKLSGWYEGETQVSTDKSYTFTVSGNRTLTAEFVEQSLPAGTKQLEYIYNIGSSAGTAAYILLPAISSAKSLEIKYAHLTGGYATNNICSLCGLVAYSSSKLSSISGITVSRMTSTRYLNVYVSGTRPVITNLEQSSFPETHTMLLDYGNAKIDIDGTIKNANPGSWLMGELMFFCPKLTGAGNYGGPAPYTAVYYAVWRDENGYVVRNLIPCMKQDGTVCMYDTVEDVFYTNQNTNTGAENFIAGPEA